MSEREIQDWFRMLGSTVEQRVKVVENLLTYARRDGMSADDMAICKAVLVTAKGV